MKQGAANEDKDEEGVDERRPLRRRRVLKASQTSVLQEAVNESKGIEEYDQEARLTALAKKARVTAEEARQYINTHTSASVEHELRAALLRAAKQAASPPPPPPSSSSSSSLSSLAAAAATSSRGSNTASSSHSNNKKRRKGWWGGLDLLSLPCVTEKRATLAQVTAAAQRIRNRDKAAARKKAKKAADGHEEGGRGASTAAPGKRNKPVNAARRKLLQSALDERLKTGTHVDTEDEDLLAAVSSAAPELAASQVAKWLEEALTLAAKLKLQSWVASVDGNAALEAIDPAALNACIDSFVQKDQMSLKGIVAWLKLRSGKFSGWQNPDFYEAFIEVARKHYRRPSFAFRVLGSVPPVEEYAMYAKAVFVDVVTIKVDGVDTTTLTRASVLKALIAVQPLCGLNRPTAAQLCQTDEAGVARLAEEWNSGRFQINADDA